MTIPVTVPSACFGPCSEDEVDVKVQEVDRMHDRMAKIVVLFISETPQVSLPYRLYKSNKA
jgi:hypothetical protein